MNEPQESSGAAAANQEDVDVKWRKKSGSSDGAQAPSGEAQEPTEGDAESWEEKYLQEQAKADDYLSRWQRSQADLVNLRRRGQQEREDTIKRANEELIRDMLPVL